MTVPMDNDHNWWKDFARAHQGDFEDAYLSAMVEEQRAGTVPGPAVLTWQEVKEANTGTAVIEYVDGEPEPGTPMRRIKMMNDSGQPVELFVPADIPEKGMRVRINGEDGILYSDPSDDAPTASDVEDVEADIMRATDIAPRVLGQPIPHVTAFGFIAHDALRDELIEAWAHVQHHNCEGARLFVDRFLAQLIAALAESQGRSW